MQDNFKIYVCGPTVYSEVHIGNMRPILSFDIFIRGLNRRGQKTTFVHNITDVDDKIINRAIEENISEKEVAEKYTDLYFDLLNQVNVTTVNKFPLVTNYINEIINFVKDLLDQKKAYLIEDGVYFDVSTIDNYGHLSKKDIESMKFDDDLVAGKRNGPDFALWKITNVGVKWESPWGLGRPGWHTECVVFIDEIFEHQTINLHGGGIDLIFPHHENEDAQFRAKFDNRDLADQWKHVGHVNWMNQKMSKSLGNIIKAQTFIDLYGVDLLRFLFLTSNVTSPIEITQEMIDNSQLILQKWGKTFRKAQLSLLTSQNVVDSFELENIILDIAQDLSDWNFAQAVKKINNILRNFNKTNELTQAWLVIESLKLVGFAFSILEIEQKNLEVYHQWKHFQEEKDYQNADILRSELISLGLL